MRYAVTALAAMAAVAVVQPSSAASYRILYQGSEALAMQSGGVRAAGFVAPGGAPNLANDCPTCVRGPNTKGAGVPNQIVTFLHPYTQKAITVPLTLPAGKPRLVTRADRIIYNYGLFGYKVVVRFLPNGQVEVRYRT